MFNHLHTTRVTVAIILLLVITSVQAQTNTAVKEATVQMQADIQADHIALRWAVDQPLAWKKTNQYGFRLTRYTISRDKQVLDVPVAVDLGVFKPLTLPEWEPLANDNDQAAIVAQALYGESFEVEMANQGPLEAVINQSADIEQRFAFALMAADMDFAVAQLAGWGYVDYDVQPNEQYLYRVEALTPVNELIPYGGQIKRGSVYVSIDDYEPLPQPIDFVVVPGDQQMLLSWDYSQLVDTYNAYVLERSDDGQNFQALTDVPLVNLNNKDGKPARVMFHVDTIPQNNTVYHYRLKGINSFGYRGPYTEVLSAEGKSRLNYLARINKTRINAEGNVDIYWEFPQEGQPHITGFELLHSTSANGQYASVQGGLQPAWRQTTYGPLEASNYFKIRALGLDGDNSESYAVLVQPIDTVPPAVPSGLTGEIDTLGVVHLSWQANTEADLLGYRLFKANIASEEMVQITSEPIEATSYIDSTVVKSLNERVYYSLVAVDKRYNMSDYSAVLELEKPDVVPPQAPVISNYKLENGAVSIDFIKSYSGDVVSHRIFRQNLSEPAEKAKGFKQVFDTSAPTNKLYHYTDTEVEDGVQYRYVVFAYDKAGLRSPVSQPLTVKAFNAAPKQVISFLGYEINRNDRCVLVYWQHNREQVSKLQLYKATNEASPALLSELPAGAKELKDTKVKPGNAYTYYVRAILPNGHFSQMEQVVVEY